jgi:hypothetical protein
MDAITTVAPTHSLRERMLQDITMRGFGAYTQKHYIRHVRSFAAFLGRPPGHGHDGIPSALSGRPARARRGAGHDQWGGIGTAVPLRDNSQAPGDGARARCCSLHAQAAGGLERRGDSAAVAA